MEFQKGPMPVPENYQQTVAQTLASYKVTRSGLFLNTGEFKIASLGKQYMSNDTITMWARNLLNFTEGEDGVRTTREGWLYVYHGRMDIREEKKIEPVHTIVPGNVRFVKEYDSYYTTVRQSGWLVNDQRIPWALERRDEGITPDKIEQILIEAEAGTRPPFLEDILEFIKVEPGFEGKIVRVVRFKYIRDAVVIDHDTKELIGISIESPFSAEKWEATSKEPASNVGGLLTP